MEDAHTIGIRLVLDDGVSAGMAVMMAEMSALDRALAGVERASGAARVRVAEPVPAARPAVALPGEAAPVARSPEPRVVAGVAISRGPSVPAVWPRREREVPQPGAVLARPSAVPARPAVMPQPAAAPRSAVAAAPMAPEVVRFALDVAPAPSVAPAVRITQMTAETAATGRVLAAAPQVVPALPAVAGREAMPGRSAAPLGAQDWRDVGALATPAAAVSAVMTPPRLRPAAPALPWGVTGSSERPAPAVASGPARPMAPLAQPQGQTGPGGGDVFLDGVRLGHWMMNTLGRAAARPQTGATGFDPRMGMAWPGTLQGG